MTFSFRDLTLGDVQTQSSGSLAPGRYVATVTEAKIDKTQSGGTQLMVQFKDTSSGVGIRDYITLHTPKSDTAGRIGRERLKALLVHGGHKDPDNIGQHGVESMRNLTVGITVVEDTYIKDGQERKGSRLKQNGCYFPPSDMGGSIIHRDDGTIAGMKDDVPF